MTTSDGHCRGTLLFLVVLLLLGLITSVSNAADFSYTAMQVPDVVVAGGLDGHVYAINAWSGQVLWSFDSGGPMVDSSQCLGVTPTSTRNMPPNYQSAAAKLRKKTKGHVQQMAEAQAIAASKAFMSQLVPSYDGRLYHFSKTKVQELGMTMADIVMVNGPVRVAVDTSSTSGDVDSSAADILLFGEKKLEMFTLNAVSGLRRPFSSSAISTSEIFFGRSEFTTRAVYSSNASSARCFKISEYFLDFTQQPHCSIGDDGPKMFPEILVMPKDPDSAVEDEGSTIVAFDPWTSEQLWEFEVPGFDVLAVHGVSTTRGATFYKWKVDGPSSSASKRVRTPARVGAEGLHRYRHWIDSSSSQQSVNDEDQESERENAQIDQQLVRVVPRTWDAMELRFRLRLMGDNYFLESSEDGGVALDDNGARVTHGSPTFHGRQADDAHNYHEDMGSHRRRQILWEPIINDGKRGVFITYTHVGAMLLGVAMCGILLAWGCYVKGLSASLAQSAIKTMDQSQFFTSHVHRLIIQQIGMTTGTATDAIEKFSRLAANEASAILLNGGHIVRKRKLLVEDPDADSTVTTATFMSSVPSSDMIVRGALTSSPSIRLSRQGSALASGRIALPYAEDEILSEVDILDVYEALLPAREENAEFLSSTVDHMFDGDRFELAHSDDEFFDEGDDFCGNHERRESAQEDETTDEKSSEEKSSDRDSCGSSSSESDTSPNEAEVLFPFVCQSRFVNEFEELSAIGKGGFGQVMLAENRLDGREYAIKRVGLNLKNQTSKTLQKFLREVKILALLDHPNIIRAQLDGLADAKNYSTSNLLAPISELEFSVNQCETFYSNGSMVSDHDDGFEWERGSSSGVEGDNGWKEEDLVVQNKPRITDLPSRVSSSCLPAARGSDEDSSFNPIEKCDHWLYIQMQYCAGRNLADYLAVPTRPMELSRMLKIFVQIASALTHVHSCGLIHRDLKPANIFVADVDRDEIKLGDFGLSRYAANVNNLNAPTSLDESQQGPPSAGLRETHLSMSMWSNMSESNEVTAGVGTYLYASPEQVAGKKYNAKTDIYSLGMILFELCHERFGTTMERYITLRNARDSNFPTDLLAAKRCPEILDMLCKLLSHDPTARPTADEIVQWGQMMYETSLAQKAMDIVRSPRNLDLARPAAGAYPFVPGIDHLMADAVDVVVTTTFSLKVEAAMEHCSGEDGGGERRLPNHNLLKQVCDVIAGVHNGKIEIKKCGLHMESEGVTILEFELDPQSALADAPASDVEGAVIVAIEALAGVQIVHRMSRID
ncbi:unnamed protein product [Peronospora destructor]|uniref:non-specific serine/threonine protein kinase n=1 Tax=Peronospora destructor TaxID=86335 RepID=A0AAV0TH00_9STRA|nr:unnamed protein product [Peronospora destructor]